MLECYKKGGREEGQRCTHVSRRFLPATLRFPYSPLASCIPVFLIGDGRAARPNMYELIAATAAGLNAGAGLHCVLGELTGSSKGEGGPCAVARPELRAARRRRARHLRPPPRQLPRPFPERSLSLLLPPVEAPAGAEHTAEYLALFPKAGWRR